MMTMTVLSPKLWLLSRSWIRKMAPLITGASKNFGKPAIFHKSSLLIFSARILDSLSSHDLLVSFSNKKFFIFALLSQRLELMRHIYNGEEGDFTDLTIAPPNPVAPNPESSASKALEASNLAALPPRCVFSCLTQNMCVGELRCCKKSDDGS